MKEYLTLDKDNNIEYADHCYFCDTMEDLQKHHIIRVKDGGLNTPENMVLICRKCHNKIHKNYFLYFSKGYLIMINRLDYLEKYYPNSRQEVRNLPKKSLKIAIANGSLRI